MLIKVIGKLVADLKAKGEYENTLIMLCADNGACPFDRTTGADKEPWDAESYWCYDTGWSHVGNVPFRLHKTKSARRWNFQPNDRALALRE